MYGESVIGNLREREAAREADAEVCRLTAHSSRWGGATPAATGRNEDSMGYTLRARLPRFPAVLSCSGTGVPKATPNHEREMHER